MVLIVDEVPNESSSYCMCCEKNLVTQSECINGLQILFSMNVEFNSNYHNVI